MVVATAGGKLLLSEIRQPLFCFMKLLKVNAAVLVRDKSKRIVRTYHTLDIYSLKKRGHMSEMPVYLLYVYYGLPVSKLQFTEQSSYDVMMLYR